MSRAHFDAWSKRLVISHKGCCSRHHLHAGEATSEMESVPVLHFDADQRKCEIVALLRLSRWRFSARVSGLANRAVWLPARRKQSAAYCPVTPLRPLNFRRQTKILALLIGSRVQQLTAAAPFGASTEHGSRTQTHCWESNADEIALGCLVLEKNELFASPRLR